MLRDASGVYYVLGDHLGSASVTLDAVGGGAAGGVATFMCLPGVFAAVLCGAGAAVVGAVAGGGIGWYVAGGQKLE